MSRIRKKLYLSAPVVRTCVIALVLVATAVAGVFITVQPATASEGSYVRSCSRVNDSSGGAFQRCGFRAIANSGAAAFRRQTRESVGPECISNGLTPIPVSLTAQIASTEAGRVNTPRTVVVWRGRPLPKSCEARVALSFDARVWFENLSEPIELGVGPEGWQVFWGGRGVADPARKVYSGPTFSFPLGCITKARAWVRYRVIGYDGETVARRTRGVAVHHPLCR